MFLKFKDEKLLKTIKEDFKSDLLIKKNIKLMIKAMRSEMTL